MSSHKPDVREPQPAPRAARALIIDDDPSFPPFLDALLRRIGVSVIAARNGEAGLARAAASRPDIIFLDWVFPMGLSGQETLARLKADPVTKGIPVVVISGEPASPLAEPEMKELGTGLFLPKAALSDSARDPLALRERLRSLMVPPPLCGRILVVDDDPGFQEFLDSVLVRRGYELMKAGSGNEGMAIARERHPDLILLDLTLPGMNGVEFYQLLKADAALRSVPVIMMTALDDPAGVLRSAIGMVAPAGFLRKPFGENEILLQVRRILSEAEKLGRRPATERVLIHGKIKLDLVESTLTTGDATPREVGPKRRDLLYLLIKHPQGLRLKDALKAGWEKRIFGKTLERLREDLGGSNTVVYRDRAYHLNI